MIWLKTLGSSLGDGFSCAVGALAGTVVTTIAVLILAPAVAYHQWAKGKLKHEQAKTLQEESKQAKAPDA